MQRVGVFTVYTKNKNNKTDWDNNKNSNNNNNYSEEEDDFLTLKILTLKTMRQCLLQQLSNLYHPTASLLEDIVYMQPTPMMTHQKNNMTNKDGNNDVSESSESPFLLKVVRNMNAVCNNMLRSYQAMQELSSKAAALGRESSDSDNYLSLFDSRQLKELRLSFHRTLQGRQQLINVNMKPDHDNYTINETNHGRNNNNNTPLMSETMLVRDSIDTLEERMISLQSIHERFISTPMTPNIANIITLIQSNNSSIDNNRGHGNGYDSVPVIFIPAFCLTPTPFQLNWMNHCFRIGVSITLGIMMRRVFMDPNTTRQLKRAGEMMKVVILTNFQSHVYQPILYCYKYIFSRKLERSDGNSSSSDHNNSNISYEDDYQKEVGVLLLQVIVSLSVCVRARYFCLYAL